MKKIDEDIYAVCHSISRFASREHFKECIEAVMSGMYDSSFTAERIQHLMWTDKNKPMNFDSANIPRTKYLPVYYSEVPAA